MQFSESALKKKQQFYNAISSKAPFLNAVIKKHLHSTYQLNQISREWEPGGGSTLFEIVTPENKIFLKVMSLDIAIESKIESEDTFSAQPSIRNEYQFITSIRDNITPVHVPKIFFYKEVENYGIFATEWLEPFDSSLASLTITETIETFQMIREYIHTLFLHNILYTDLHEKNIRFRNRTPVLIDYGETRNFVQNLPFDQSLHVVGHNSYGSLGEFPALHVDDVSGFTCLTRLKMVFDKVMPSKLQAHAQQCIFDNSCPFNADIHQEPDPRIYQSLEIPGLKFKGHRPANDEREYLIAQVCALYSLVYGAITYFDIGSNVGNFCFKMASLRNVRKAIGIEASEDYVLFARGRKFLLNDVKTHFYCLLGGKDSIYDTVREVHYEDAGKKIVTILSTYHHISDKQSFLDDIRSLGPALVIMEFATQERYYSERGGWQAEMMYIQRILRYPHAIILGFSSDYNRPIVAFTSGKIARLMLFAVVFRLAIHKKRIRRYILPLISQNIRWRPARSSSQQTSHRWEHAITWIKNHRSGHAGIAISSKNPIPYPEVTGYIIPTLYQWGEKKLARDFIRWLITQQNPDGSFSAPDGTPYTFDTGQVVRGFVAALGDLTEVERPLRKACDWILTQVQPDGRLDTPSTKHWGTIADDRIHLYVLPPLIESGKLLNCQTYIDSADHILQHYKRRENLTHFDTLSHFHAYVLEALCDVSEYELAKKSMEAVETLLKKNGSVPAYAHTSWVCSTGLAQYAVIWYKLGLKEPADKALRYAQKLQNRSGGFYGSYGRKAEYFPKEEISWAVKFFLDALHWKIKTSFDLDVKSFPDTIDRYDGRVTAVLSSLGDITGKKVADIGCGKGRFLRILRSEFPESDLYGIDISDEMLSCCPDGIKTLCASILDIRYPDNFFDAVYCVEALEHALRIENAIQELVRILKPGGNLLIIDKNIAKLGQLPLASWEQWFQPEDILNVLEKYHVDASYKLIPYGNDQHPDGLFVAWQGQKQSI